MKSRFAIFSVMLVLILFLCGCSGGSYITTKSVEKNNANEMSMKYEKFKGYKYYKLKVKEGEEIIVTVDIKTENGKISAYIAKDDDVENAVYRGTNIPTSNFTVSITESGTYTIRVDAVNHKGSYSFKW
ncbi:PPC domain-containing protein [Sedimentibacter sp. zth1]|uniref:PPC domain-containing protein n=1 Tax=Sedimentibacter sp. zth1 TaxID=2816908 RepID=UPI001A923CCE|nr:PPC domain-containing protein [Sedimentibacter sp. zth1]QSX05531.1 PPC domain-containing protein [Sedimentibacter sp. zth1]